MAHEHSDSPVARNDLHAIALARLRRSAQRYTTGRRRLVDLLADADNPMTIPQLLDAEPSMAQSSAYRNLSILESADVVHRIVTTDNHARYELTEELTEHHHHLICTTCGDVADFVLPAAVEHTLEAALDKAADSARFAIDQHRLDLVGTCPACR